MCGRFLLATPADEIARAFGVIGATLPDWQPRYNIAPTQDVLVARQRTDSPRELALVRWGLIPPWADSAAVGAKCINARSETAATQPAFRGALKDRRCLVPADGFYEWEKVPGGKRPVLIRPRRGGTLGLAGLWDRWRSPGGQVVESCAILTCRSGPSVAAVYDRMPVILEPREYEAWLDAGKQEPDIPFDAFPDAALDVVPVSALVNSPRNDSLDCIRPAEPKAGLFG